MTVKPIQAAIIDLFNQCMNFFYSTVYNCYDR